MRSPLHVAIVVLIFAALGVGGSGESMAGGKGRGGGGHGGGAGHGHGGGKQATVHRGKPDGAQRHAQLAGTRDKQGPKQTVKRDTHSPNERAVREHFRTQQHDGVATRPGASSGDHPWSKQRANEERKLQHRLDVADRLDKLADANGNEHLHETAERMREKAHDHYGKRLSKIDSKSPLEVPDELEPAPLPDPDEGLANAAESAAGELPPAPPEGFSPQKLTGRENALQRQLRNEERKLEQRTELAERLRATAEEQGDAKLLEVADRLEEQGLARFEQRMEAIRSFQERHGLVLDETGLIAE